MRRAVPFRARDGRDGIVRPARRTDARACLRILAEAAADRPRTLAVLENEIWPPRTWRRHRLDWSARGVTLVAVLDGAVAGQLGCERRTHPATNHIAGFGITVARAARGLGVGRALLRTLELWAAEFGIARLELGVFEHNERARGLYRSLGYEEEGVERRGARFPEGDVDVVRMAKLIGPDARTAHTAGPARANESATQETETARATANPVPTNAEAGTVPPRSTRNANGG